jgi:hypothetical protein
MSNNITSEDLDIAISNGVSASGALTLFTEFQRQNPGRVVGVIDQAGDDFVFRGFDRARDTFFRIVATADGQNNFFDNPPVNQVIQPIDPFSTVSNPFISNYNFNYNSGYSSGFSLGTPSFSFGSSSPSSNFSSSPSFGNISIGFVLGQVSSTFVYGGNKDHLQLV